MRTPRIILTTSLVCLLGGGIPGPPTALGQTRGGAGQPFGQTLRDTPALDPNTASASLSGRVRRGDTSAVVKRAMVILASQDTDDLLAEQTDDSGRYQFTDFRPGRYTVRVVKPGFISLSYGQTHPRQPALPIRIDVGQQLRNVDIALPRGSVITGLVVDEDGEPMPRANVQALRYLYRQGQRRIEPAGTDQTDDRGQFRVFDLEPGDYFVSVTLPRRRFRFAGTAQAGQDARAGRGGRGGRGGPVVAVEDSVDDAETVGFAPTYYPGVTMLREATSLTVGLSQEVSGVNFAAQLVRMARVGGRVFGPDGAPARGAQVFLSSADLMGRTPGASLSGRVDRDGSFDVRGVPPGSYTVQARSGRGRRNSEQVFASQQITVDGQDVTDLTMMLRRGAELRGRVTFDGSQPDTADLELLRVTTSALNPDPTPFGRRREAGAAVEADGSFALSDIGGGRRLIRMNRPPDELQLKAVYVEGRDVIDTPLEFYPGQTVSGVTLVLTDRITELTGMVHDNQGGPLTVFTVIAFPTDEQLWQPQSRHIMASRPDQNGQYRIRGLPPGAYLLSAVEAVEQGEWFDPRFLGELRQHAARVTLRDGESTSLNLGFETPR